MQIAGTVDGNRLTVLTEGQERLAALLDLIGSARRELRLLYYIFADDAAGERVRDAMIAARARGVVVRLIVDGFGSGVTGDDAFLQPMKDAGVEVCVFIPRWGRRYLLRNHQKLALADDDRAIIGGFNIADEYFADNRETAWRDLGLIIEGDAARALGGYFDALFGWTHRPKSRMRVLKRALARWSNSNGRVRWLHGGPMRRLSPWLAALRTDLRAAKDLSMIAAYFAPTPGLTRLIDRIGQRGRARIVTAGKTDNAATIGAARFTFPGLLRKRVRVFEYQPSRLHTKLYIVDDAVHIGSANFDPRSLFLNLEIMLRIEDRDFSDAMRGYVDGEVAHSRERTRDEFTGLTSFPDRLRNTLCYFLVAILDPNISRRMRMGIE